MSQEHLKILESKEVLKKKQTDKQNNTKTHIGVGITKRHRSHMKESPMAKAGTN